MANAYMRLTEFPVSLLFWLKIFCLLCHELAYPTYVNELFPGEQFTVISLLFGETLNQLPLGASDDPIHHCPRRKMQHCPRPFSEPLGSSFDYSYNNVGVTVRYISGSC